MALTTGAKLGSYEIVAPLGVLPDLFAGDPDRLARFKRETQPSRR